MTEEKTRKTPVRTCCACGEKDEKKTLVRIVRGEGGLVSLDPRGREPGRGAYICADARCFAKARKQRKLDRALRVTLREDDYARLQESFDAYLAQSAAGEGA